MLSKQGPRIGINGIGGRIGGNFLRVAIEHPTLGFNVVAGNDVGMDLVNPAGNFVQAKAHDTTFGLWPCEMSGVGQTLVLNVQGEEFPIEIYSERDPGMIPWLKQNVRGVAECTGVFRSRAQDEMPGYDSHLEAGVNFVAISAPAKDEVLTVVHGVHTTPLSGVKLLSAASCTSGSIAFPLRVLLNNKEDWGFSAGQIVTVHAYTAGEQTLQDYVKPVVPGCRRMYAGGVNIIPATTGAASAIPKVDGIGSDMSGIPFSGYALRVPVVSGSITLLGVTLEKKPGIDDVIAAFVEAASGDFAGKFGVNANPCAMPNGLPLVSSHIIRRPESSIVDVEFCRQTGNLYTFPLWYGNEWGYVYRLAEALHEQCS